MAIAGRVAIVPKGDFDATITYKRLDMVLYKSSAYVAKKETTGNLPDNTEFWMKSTESAQVDTATTEKAGIVKPDGTTITVSEDGTITGASSGFTGTTKEFEAASQAGEIKPGTIVNITDDYTGSGGCDCDKTFTGTKEEYDAANESGDVPDGTIVNITDDYEEGGVKVDGETIIKNSDTNEISVSDQIIEKVNSAYILTRNIKGGTNAIPRGAFLGNSFTAEQAGMIANNNFEGFYVKDYWTIDGINYRIAHFNYWINTGDTPCTTPHIVVVPDTGMYTAKMNETNTTEGGYVGSDMYKTGLNQAKTMFANAFGADHILTHRELLVNTATDGVPMAGAWYDSTVDLMNEPMVYGSHFFAPANDGVTIPYLYTIDKTQLALFALCPELISNRANCWLRDVASGAYFANVSSAGYAVCYYASHAFAVLPAVGIC